MASIRLLAVAFAGIAVIGSAFPNSLDHKLIAVGDPAPPLTPAAWVQGAPVTSFQPGKLYVVDFWATWCGPCNRSMPHLSEIATKYAGKVQVIGVDVRENEAPGPALNAMVSEFVRQKGAQMSYSVCTDDFNRSMMTSWMAAAGQHGIPCAFVVDQHGKIADVALGYMGPNDHRLDASIDKLLAGTFDYKLASLSLRKLQTENAEVVAKSQAYDAIVRAKTAKDYQAMLRAVLDMSAKYRDDEDLIEDRFYAMVHLDQEKAYSAALKADSNERQRIASAFLQEGLPRKFYLYAIDAFAPHERGGGPVSSAGNGATADYGLAMLARAYYLHGDSARAVAVQAKFLAGLRASGPAKEEVSEQERVLRLYKNSHI